MKLTQTELLTTIQWLDSILKMIISRLEQEESGSSRARTLSPIAKETQEQVASNGGAIEIEESAEEEQTPQASSS